MAFHGTQIAEVASRQFVLDDFEVVDIDSDGQYEILLAANWLRYGARR